MHECVCNCSYAMQRAMGHSDCRPTATEAVTLLAEIEEGFRQQGRIEAVNAAARGQTPSVI